MSDAVASSRFADGPPPAITDHGLTPAQWGLVAFLVSEVAFFGTLIVTYLSFLGQDIVGPTPREALTIPWTLGMTACLLVSSVTVHAAHAALARGGLGLFRVLWLLTIGLGIAFLAGTAIEWRDLIRDHHLTISRNLFGTTYYTLVGFHALHVTAGVVMMLLTLGLAWRRAAARHYEAGVELISWYWHFVDGVWIVVFLVVYVASR